MLHKDDQLLKEQANEQIREHGSLVQRDPYRLHYHVMPPVGLLNDPNGLVYFNQLYHLFFQWNPFQTDHGSKFWAHMTSKDLIHWEWQPIALAPSDPFDKNGCYSGSAIVHENKLYLFYTGNVRDQAGNRESNQCLAISEDGITFEKKGPLFTVPEGYTPHFRDPKVWKENDMWYLVIGAQTEHLQGRALLYKSQNITEWQLVGEISDKEKPLTDFGYMWECPDLLLFDNQDVLLFSPQGIEPQAYQYHNIYQTGYLSGVLDRQTANFNHQEFIELDNGFDFYAPQTTVDGQGRRIMFGWMGLPETDEAFHPTKDYRWIHAMTIPRELTLKQGILYQQPVKELTQLRKEPLLNQQQKLVDEVVTLHEIHHDALEFIFQVHAFKGKSLEVSFSEHTKLVFNKEMQTLTLHRNSIKSYQSEARTTDLQELTELRVYLDASSIEVFVNQGEKVFSARLFDAIPYHELTLQVNGTLDYHLQAWSLKNVMK